MRLVVDRDGHLEATELFEPLVIVAPDGKYGICLRDDTIEVVKDGNIVFRGSNNARPVPNPLVSCYAETCPKCGHSSPCVDHVEVDIGVGTQTGQHEFWCPTHGGFAFVDNDPADFATSRRRHTAIFRDDPLAPSSRPEKSACPRCGKGAEQFEGDCWPLRVCEECVAERSAITRPDGSRGYLATFRARAEACIVGGAGTFSSEDVLLLVASHETLQRSEAAQTDETPDWHRLWKAAIEDNQRLETETAHLREQLAAFDAVHIDNAPRTADVQPLRFHDIVRMLSGSCGVGLVRDPGAGPTAEVEWFTGEYAKQTRWFPKDAFVRLVDEDRGERASTLEKLAADVDRDGPLPTGMLAAGLSSDASVPEVPAGWVEDFSYRHALSEGATLELHELVDEGPNESAEWTCPKGHTGIERLHDEIMHDVKDAIGCAACGCAYALVNARWFMAGPWKPKAATPSSGLALSAETAQIIEYLIEAVERVTPSPDPYDPAEMSGDFYLGENIKRAREIVRSLKEGSPFASATKETP